jgi:hypothetical protein
LTTIDVYLLKLAKQATEGGSTVEEVDSLLASVAIPEDLVVGDEATEGEGETLPATTGDQVSESALALLRQMAATLDRLEARDRRFDQLAQEVADLRRVIESQPSPAPAVETPKRSPWSPYLPYVIAVAVVVVAILAIALVVALLR